MDNIGLGIAIGVAIIMLTFIFVIAPTYLFQPMLNSIDCPQTNVSSQSAEKAEWALACENTKLMFGSFWSLDPFITFLPLLIVLVAVIVPMLLITRMFFAEDYDDSTTEEKDVKAPTKVEKPKQSNIIRKLKWFIH
jgi:hypothetical protein